MKPRDITLELPGMRLAARVWGEAGGRRVLALHGWLDNAATYDRLAPLLPGLELVALDFAGHGLSQHRAQHAGYHFVDWLPDVVDAADALGWDRFALMGHSMGGAVSAMVAGTVPERIERVVLLDGVAPFTAEAHEAPERVAQYLRERARLTNKKAPVYARRDDVVERLLGVAPTLSRAAAETLVSRGVGPVEGGFTWRYDARLRRISPVRLTDEHVRAFLARITAPVLLVRPEVGYPFPNQEQLAGWLATIPDLRRLDVPGQHHVHLDTPEVLAAAVLAFLIE